MRLLECSSEITLYSFLQFTIAQAREITHLCTKCIGHIELKYTHTRLTEGQRKANTKRKGQRWSIVRTGVEYYSRDNENERKRHKYKSVWWCCCEGNAMDLSIHSTVRLLIFQNHCQGHKF